MTNWIKCSDRLPEQGKKVLIFEPTGKIYNVFPREYIHIARLQKSEAFDPLIYRENQFKRYYPFKFPLDKYFYREYYWQVNSEIHFVSDEITYWMPLPEPPQDHIPDAGKMVEEKE